MLLDLEAFRLATRPARPLVGGVILAASGRTMGELGLALQTDPQPN